MIALLEVKCTNVVNTKSLREREKKKVKQGEKQEYKWNSYTH